MLNGRRHTQVRRPQLLFSSTWRHFTSATSHLYISTVPAPSVGNNSSIRGLAASARFARIAASSPPAGVTARGRPIGRSSGKCSSARGLAELRDSSRYPPVPFFLRLVPPSAEPRAVPGTIPLPSGSPGSPDCSDPAYLSPLPCGPSSTLPRSLPVASFSS
jgi:hypothetical protein